MLFPNMMFHHPLISLIHLSSVRATQVLKNLKLHNICLSSEEFSCYFIQSLNPLSRPKLLLTTNVFIGAYDFIKIKIQRRFTRRAGERGGYGGVTSS